ncbi:MAG: hypothetical protein CM1200mP13_07430 [Candidatus Pelagibacterales bacterium]|nr:MAG: hypothetical protein CM1200mP13_07430 [Pelagibacterales bacterium]
MLLHGWPGSIIEFLEIIQKLAHPEKYGGKIEDAFDVIVSLFCRGFWVFWGFHQNHMVLEKLPKY